MCSTAASHSEILDDFSFSWKEKIKLHLGFQNFPQNFRQFPCFPRKSGCFFFVAVGLNSFLWGHDNHVWIHCNPPQHTHTHLLYVINLPVPLCQCVCCCEWDLVSQTERQAALKLVPTHPGPSSAVPHVCVMSGRLIQPCHQKPYHCWTGFSAPPRCQRTSVPTLEIPWHVFWQLINVSLNAEVVTKTNKLYLVACQTHLSVLKLHKQLGKKRDA